MPNFQILFSPFVPGRAQKIDDNTILLAGLKQLSMPSSAPGSVGSTGSTAGSGLSFRSISGSFSDKQSQKSILEQIFFQNASYVGTVLVQEVSTNSVLFEYVSSENVVVSDACIDPRDGQFFVAETSFSSSGRIIKLDALGNIIFSYGEGVMGVINSINANNDGTITIST